VLRKLLGKAITDWGADIAACMIIEFVRLELGEEPDPEYGSFPPWENPRDVPRDENWFLEDEIDRIRFGGDPDDEDDSYVRSLAWVNKWEAIFEDPAKFEEAFPGMAHRRENALRALQPVFQLNRVHEFFVIAGAIDAMQEVLKSQFEENRHVAEPRTLMDFAAL